MKRITVGLLTVCGVLSAQAPAQTPAKNEKKMPTGPPRDSRPLSRHRDRADHEGNQLPAPQRSHEDRLPAAPR